MDLKSGFDEVAQRYDSERKLLIPCAEDFYRLAISVIDCKCEEPRILDIGSGTGLFAALILKQFPKAKITLIDLSEEMLKIARQRFADNPNVEYVCADYITHKFDNLFNIIISGLSIHHLSADDKQSLYNRCYTMLTDDGIFVNADQALSPYPQIEEVFIRLWKQQVEQSGLPADSIAKAYARMQHDRPSPLADQLMWLKNAGFPIADCVYKYYHFCVMFAKK